MALDPTKNFLKETLASGYSLSATAITLPDASRFPNPAVDGAFNIVWWNVTDYPDPADDPNKEIVRVTAITGNIATITRAQEGTTATAKNLSGKSYQIALALTKKTMDDIDTTLETATGDIASLETRIDTAEGDITQIEVDLGVVEGDIATLESSKQDTLGFTPENVANKENTTLDTSTTKYPTNRLVKEGLDTKQNSIGFTPENVANKSTDVSTDGSSDTKYPSVKAIKDYADDLVIGAVNYRSGYDASVNTFPTTGGSGTAGAVRKGNMWIISVAGTLGGEAVSVGDSIIANVNTPGQTASNWNILNSNITYVPEDVANKVTSVTGNESSDTKYASVKSIYDWATGLFAPQTRTLTINGVAQDLSANRSWTVAVPTLTSELTNDSGFITSSALASYLPKAGDTYTTTTGNGLALTTSTLTTGSLVSLSSTGTGAGSNTQTVLKIATSGANGTSSQTTYGAYVTNTHTGTTSTNVGLYVSASGATYNYGLIVASGNVGIGTTAPPLEPRLALVGGTITGIGASNSTLQLRHATENVGHATAIEFTFGNGNNSYCGSRIVGETASAGGGHLHFQTGSSSLGYYSTKMYIEKAGNVGIGTTSPRTLLHISSSGAGSATGQEVLRLSSAANGNGNGPRIQFTDNNNTTFTSAIRSAALGSSNTGLIFSTGYSSSTDAVIINGVGNYGVGIGLGSLVLPTARLHIGAGTATAGTAPLKFNSGTNLTTAEAGAMEYNNTPHFTNSDATRRHMVLSPSATKVTAGAPYTNDGYITLNIGGTDVNVMTTA